jgi:D-aminoacyl-tRNA deacylase
MRTVVQRVKEASVSIQGAVKSAIGPGLLVLLGIEETDTSEDVAWLCGKLVRLRIFDDAQGVMNLSVLESGGEILVVSQFTLFASTKKGNRPSYSRAAKSETAIPLYENFVQQLTLNLGKRVPTGEFGALMEVKLVNDGPVTILIDTQLKE